MTDTLYDHGREIPVLIWCHDCRRYIAHETTHGCPLPADVVRKRRIDRRLKVEHERTKAAA